MTETQLIIILYVLVAIRLGSHFAPHLIRPEAKRRSWHEFIDSVVVAGVTALLLINFVVRSFYIPSASMESTLLIDDFILVNEFIYKVARPQRGDIIVFTPPDEANQGGEKKDFIKRVVGIEGDVLEIRNGWLYRNGQKIVEPYVEETEEALKMGGPGPLRGIKYLNEGEKFVVRPGNLFVMGDNRENSMDSRAWGELPVENVVGKAFLIFFNKRYLWPPWERIQLLHSNPGTPAPSDPTLRLP